MTPVGHTLTGLAIGYAVMPFRFSPRAKAATLGVFAILAFAPDLPLPSWGHDRYDISHSVFVTTLGVLLVGVAAYAKLRGSPYMSWPLLVGGAVAWYSHLLLDTFYNHGKGLHIFWPFGDGRVALPIPWFSKMNLDPLLTMHNFRVWTIEAVAYGFVLGAVVIVRRFADNRSLAKPN